MRFVVEQTSGGFIVRDTAPASDRPSGAGLAAGPFGDKARAQQAADALNNDPAWKKSFWFDRVVKACLHGVEKAAMQEDSGPLGGYIVPFELANRVSELMAEESILLSLADVYPMGSATLKVSVTDVGSTAAAGKSPFFGGVSFVWTSEAATLTESEPAFRQLDLKAWELALTLTSSNQLLEDGGLPLEEYLVKLLGKAGAWAVDYACLVGNGVGKPLGVLNAPGAISVARAGSGHVVQADLVGMAAKLLPLSWNRAIWVLHPSVLADLFKITGWQPNQPAQTIFTRPYYVTEKLPALGTVGDIMLFDPGAYAIGDRQQIEIAVSPHVNFSKNQSVWRAIIRVDGRPTLDKSVTLADGAQTASAYITLAT